MSRKGMAVHLAAFLLLSIIAAGVIFSALAFVWSFRYHVRATISSDAIASKSSLLPLSFMTLNYRIDVAEPESFVVQLAKARAGMIDEEEFLESINQKVTEQTQDIRGQTELCFRMKIHDSNIGENTYGWFTTENFPSGCKQETVYRNFYAVPIIFNDTPLGAFSVDGTTLLKKLEFTTHEIRIPEPVERGRGVP